MIEAAERGVDLLAPSPGRVRKESNWAISIWTGRSFECASVQGERGLFGADTAKMEEPGIYVLMLNAVRHVHWQRIARRGGRLRVHPRDIATAYGRAREASEAFKGAYAIRAGIESTNAECKTAHGLGNVWT